MQEYSEKYELSILSYCLMPDQVHFIAVPKKEDSFARVFNTAHIRYAQYINKKMGEKGHLWQGRFFSCILGDTHLLNAVRYVERNPVRKKLAKNPWEWKWSSAGAHIGEGDPFIKLGDLFKYIDIEQSEWKEFIENENDKQEEKLIKKHTLVGRPLGDKKFLKRIEKMLNIRIPSLKRGRPWTNK
ncbi:MAG: transposase [Candidatus Omnitrophica bacterium]|nr:transposase [Candidatus Omnitrophota bacterium]